MDRNKEKKQVNRGEDVELRFDTINLKYLWNT